MKWTRPPRDRQRSSVQMKSRRNEKTEIFYLNTTALILALLHSIPATVTINIPPLTKHETNTAPSRLLQIESHFGAGDAEKGVREVRMSVYCFFFPR